MVVQNKWKPSSKSDLFGERNKSKVPAACSEKPNEPPVKPGGIFAPPLVNRHNRERQWPNAHGPRAASNAPGLPGRSFRFLLQRRHPQNTHAPRAASNAPGLPGRCFRFLLKRRCQQLTSPVARSRTNRRTSRAGFGERVGPRPV